jgi:hypothetical protein
MGRPPIYDSPEALQKLVDEFFEIEPKPTLAGLAVHLGMSRSTLYNYKEKDQFLDIIKKATDKVEAIYEKRLVWDNNTGVIFPLKNMGWKDKTETEFSGGLDVGKKPSWFNETT